MSTRQRQQGFTLIELLIVVLIIGLLATVAIPVFNGQRKKAKYTVAKTAVKNAMDTWVAYYAANDTFAGWSQAKLNSDEPIFSTTAPDFNTGSGPNANPYQIAMAWGTIAGSDNKIGNMVMCSASKADQIFCLNWNSPGHSAANGGPGEITYGTFWDSNLLLNSVYASGYYQRGNWSANGPL